MAQTDLLIAGKDAAHQLAGQGSAWVQDMGVYARRIEIRTVGAITTIYKGWAPYGSAEAAAVWMIARLILDATTELDVTDGIAGGVSNTFSFTWTGRAGHAYS